MNKKCKKNKGSTLAEVLVGFTLLMILAAGFTKIIQLSNTFIIRSKDMLYEAEALDELMYKGEGAAVHSDIAMLEAEDYSGSGAVQRIQLNDVTLETYGMEGSRGHIYINRFSDER